jgi:hypothetical protein
MPKPIPYFNFSAKGLVVDFYNKTTNTPIDSSLWDFGFSIGGIQQTSTQNNPTGIIFPNEGPYSITLSCTNSEGTGTFTFVIYLSNVPNLNISISEMLMMELPAGVSISDIYYSQLIRKWQLYLQAPLSISGTDVFDENKWPPLANILIGKLLVYDLLLLASKNLMTSSFVGSGSIPSNTVLLTDYSITIDFHDPINISSIKINSVEIPGPSESITDNPSMVNWLNTLAKGTFEVSGNDIISNGNSNAISILTYSYQGDAGVVQVLFKQSNQRISSISNTNTTGATSTTKQVKRIETGPSNAEWFDMSAYWSNIFKSGIINNIKEEICMFAGRLKVRLYFCKKLKSTKIFIVGHKGGGCL